MHWSVWCKLLLLVGLSIGLLGASGGGCGGENLFDGLADDGSREAKLAEAQLALDRGECQRALNLFTEVYGSSPTGVKERMDLAAARMCNAGFSAITLASVAADFKASPVTSGPLFNKIADRTITSLGTNWQTDVSSAKTLLATSPITSPPTAYNNDADAAFNLSVVVLIESVLTVVDIMNFVNGVVDCVNNQGLITTNCQISAANATTIINGLQDASSVLTSLGLSSNVTDSANSVLNGLKAVAVDPNNLACVDIVSYLNSQSMSGASCI